MKVIFSLLLGLSGVSFVTAHAENKDAEDAYSTSLFSLEEDLELSMIQEAETNSLTAFNLEEPALEKIDDPLDSFASNLEEQEAELGELENLITDDSLSEEELDTDLATMVDENIEKEAQGSETLVAETVESSAPSSEISDAHEELQEEIADSEEKVLPTSPSTPSLETSLHEDFSSSSLKDLEQVRTAADAANELTDNFTAAPQEEAVIPQEIASPSLDIPEENASVFDLLEMKAEMVTDVVVEDEISLPFLQESESENEFSIPAAPVAKSEERAPVSTKNTVQTTLNKPGTIEFDSSPLISDDEMANFEMNLASAPSPLQPPSPLPDSENLTAVKHNSIFKLDLAKAFYGSPLIYTLLILMSMIAFGIWCYNLLNLQNSSKISAHLLKNLRTKLMSNNYDEALSVCMQENSFFCRMMASGISSRKFGPDVMVESMKAEGKRATISFWQRISLLNDIAIIAPMLGLLGTVLGMFYAFYDLNRSMESVSTLFDGLGISVGTTVIGLIVAIFALVLQSLGKYKLVKVLAHVENEAHSMVAMIDSKAAVFHDR